MRRLVWAFGGCTYRIVGNLIVAEIDFAKLLGYIQSLTTASECKLFGWVIRALDLYWYKPGSIPSQAERSGSVGRALDWGSKDC